MYLLFQTVLEPSAGPVVPDSVLTPDNGSDGGKGLTSPQTVPHFMTPQSHDYPTPPSNDPSHNYHPGEFVCACRLGRQTVRKRREYWEKGG